VAGGKGRKTAKKKFRKFTGKRKITHSTPAQEVTMTYASLTIEHDASPVGVITLNQPDTLNTFTSPMAGELHTALMEMEGDPAVRVVLIRSEGRAFCAGIDVNELEGQSPLEYRAWIGHMEQPFTDIVHMKTPIIAAVQGVAAANGMGLAVAADLTIAADNTRMGLTAINVGLNCVGPVLPVARVVGRKKAMELLLFGELIPAEELLRLGLVNRVVPKADLDKEARAWAEKLAQKSPLAVQIAKSSFYASEDMNYAQQFDFMNDAFARLCTTDDAKEGVKAFFEKRTPKWNFR
jgi:enoyl-CoA hydratase/carnithine racemase